MIRAATRPSRPTGVLVASCVGGLLGIGGCRSTTDAPLNAPPPSGTGAVRVVNGIADAATVNAAVGGTSADANQIAVDGASALLSLPSGRYTVQVQPDHGSAFSVGGVGVGAGTLSTVVANGVLANSTQRGFVASESLAPPAAGQVAVQPVFGAYAYGGRAGSQGYGYTFSFTLLGPSTQGAGSNESTLYGQSPATLALPSGQYRIGIISGPNCPSDQACPTNASAVLDTGTSPGVMLPATNGVGANVVQLVAVDATSAQQDQYGSGVVLLLLDGSGGVTPIYNAH